MRLCVLHNLYFYNTMMDKSEMLWMPVILQDIRNGNWKACNKGRIKKTKNQNALEIHKININCVIHMHKILVLYKKFVYDV